MFRTGLGLTESFELAARGRFARQLPSKDESVGALSTAFSPSALLQGSSCVLLVIWYDISTLKSGLCRGLSQHLTMATLVEKTELRAGEMVATDNDRADSISLEKEDRYETVRPIPGLSQEDSEWMHSLSEKEKRSIFHKVDKRLVPMLALLYLIAHLDRASMSIAAFASRDFADGCCRHRECKNRRCM